MNLAVNARDAMPSGGRLSVSVDAIDLDQDEVAPLPGLRPGPHVRITVRDTGTGMTAAAAARAFDPFFSTKPMAEGTGLGLSMVYGMVRRAGGHAGIASAMGEGTSVTIHLPAANAVEEPAAGPGLVGPPGERILVVDDEPGVRRATVAFLTAAGYVVMEAGTPSEAVRAAAGGIDLLVTDVVLPEMTGPQLARLLRERRPGLPAVFISGYAPATADGIDDASFLPKPFTPDALIARVRASLSLPVMVS